MRFAHNLIHDAPHNAILFWGNDFLIENNEIYRVCLETGDAGAIYTGRDYTYRGNVIRRNFIHHMGGVGMGTMAIYMDDCVSGTHIAENTLWRCQTAVVLGGGPRLHRRAERLRGVSSRHRCRRPRDKHQSGLAKQHQGTVGKPQGDAL